MTDDQSQPQLYNLTRRKVLAGLGAVGLASAGAGLGTSAFYQDIESLTASLQAGKVDLFLDYRATYNPWLSPEEFEAKQEVLLGENAAGGFERIPTDDGEGFTDSYAVGQAPDIRDSEGGVLSFGEWGDALMNGALRADLCGDREYDPENGYTGFINALNADTQAGYTLGDTLGPQGFVNGPEGFMFDLADVKPYDEGEVTMSLHLCGNDSYLYLQPELVSNMENSRNEPEFTAGDVDSAVNNGTADPDSGEIIDDFGELADYLHVSLFVDENCDNRKNRGMDGSSAVDVALVLDQSGSISSAEYAQVADAAKLVVDAIAASDQSSAIAFSSGASVEQELTTDKNAVKTAIDNRVFGGGTAIDAGITAAQGELTSSRARSNADQVIVLLSDGFSDPTSAAQAADAAKSAGIRILTVGFGFSPGSTGEQLLRAIAGTNADSVTEFNSGMIDDEGDYFFAPDEDDLDEAFGEIAEVIVEGEVCVYEGSLAGLVALADGGEIPLAFDTIVDDGELPAERECFEQGTYCYAFEWQLPCKPEEFEELRSFTVVEDGEFGSFADEVEGKGLPLDGNVTQSDSLQVRFTYRAEQCRHNMDGITTTTGEGFVKQAEDFNGASQTEAAFARGRFGDNGPSGAWEVAIGEPGSPTPQLADKANYVWTPGNTVPFEYQSDGAGNASFTLDGVTVDATGLPAANGRIGIQTKADDATIEVANLQLETDMVQSLQGSTGVVSTNDGDGRSTNYLVIETVAGDLSGGFTLSGDVTVDIQGDFPGGDEDVAFDVVIE
jgi:uncharacterized protein YegL